VTGAPAVIAHRGASWDEPANTLRAFRRAIRAGADYVELDVQATRDGELVAVHDPLRDTLAELLARSPETPRLAEVLEECAGRIGLAVELKHPYRHRRHRLVECTLDALARHRIAPAETLVFSFEPAALREVAARRPDLRAVQLLGTSPPRVTAPAWGVGLLDARATSARIAAARGRGLATLVYTVNDERRMRELAELGVDGVVTDRPESLLRVLGRG
jgi:glycerophosphoryl diester phosphodiesterase